MNDRELAFEKHDYRLFGKSLVNVTAISGLLDDGKSGAFAGAAVKLTKDGKNYREEWKRSGERGTRIHGYCESYLRGESIACADEDAGYVDAVEKFLVEKDPITIELERVVLSEDGYGGRFDMVVALDGSPTLLDLKSGRPYPAEHTLQLSAYRFAMGMAVYNDAGELAKLDGMPPIERAGCLYVHEDGTYDLRYYPADQEAFEIFLGLLDAYRWSRSNKMVQVKVK